MLTATEQRIYDKLKDGRPHGVLELRSLLWDELASIGAVRVQVSNLRAKLAKRGEVIVCSRSRYILTMLTLDSAS